MNGVRAGGSPDPVHLALVHDGRGGGPSETPAALPGDDGALGNQRPGADRLVSTSATATILASFRAGDAWRSLSWELSDRFPTVPEAEREDRLQQAFVIALEKCRA